MTKSCLFCSIPTGQVIIERPPRLVNPEAWAKFVQRFEKIFGFRPAER